MKNKSVIIAGLVVLTVLLVVSIVAVNNPQQAGIKAQTDAAQQCQNDGGFITDQSGCSGTDKQVVSVIGDTNTGGDSGTVQVCCKTITTNTPIPQKSCPVDTVEKPEAECDPNQIVTPDNSTADGGDGKYVQPGIVCCRMSTPTTPPDEPNAATPTPNSCLLPEASVTIEEVTVMCPDGCSNTTQ